MYGVWSTISRWTNKLFGARGPVLDAEARHRNVRLQHVVAELRESDKDEFVRDEPGDYLICRMDSSHPDYTLVAVLRATQQAENSCTSQCGIYRISMEGNGTPKGYLYELRELPRVWQPNWAASLGPLSSWTVQQLTSVLAGLQSDQHSRNMG